ncbi:unnamed protein product, partial [Mesorhabditis belari]|uniref:Uncharacterized protein n=1 Tax=Mesorhabditis belari TaxID=2138241 RepID=A0AAF3F829_9BILA
MRAGGGSIMCFDTTRSAGYSNIGDDIERSPCSSAYEIPSPAASTGLMAWIWSSKTLSLESLTRRNAARP